MLKFVNQLLQDEDGATAIEYVLLAGLISIAAIAAMTSVGGSIKNTFSHVANQVDDAAKSAGTTGGGKVP